MDSSVSVEMNINSPFTAEPCPVFCIAKKDRPRKGSFPWFFFVLGLDSDKDSKISAALYATLLT